MVFNKVAKTAINKKRSSQRRSNTQKNNFIHFQQCATLWCWAACGAMMIKHHKKKDYSQFDFAAARFKDKDVYNYKCNGLPNHFNKPQMPAEFLKKLGNILADGISNSEKDELWTGLVKEIASKTPLLMGIAYNEKEDQGHFIIVSNVVNDIYYVNNPKYPEVVPESREWFFFESNFSTHKDGAFWSHAFSVK